MWGFFMTRSFSSVQSIIDDVSPDEPLMVVRPQVIRTCASRFLSVFPGDVLYAVKCNHDPLVLDALYEGGVRHFDVASLHEVHMVTERFPWAQCHYMNPIKSFSAIEQSYYRYAVRTFALDHFDELQKILKATKNAQDMTLIVRLDMPQGQAKMCLSGKFGATEEEAISLIQSIQSSGNRVGLTFHVGSQCVHIAPFVEAVRRCGRVAHRAGVELAVLDIGGGFPGRYTGDEPDIQDIYRILKSEIANLNLSQGYRLCCEPGRSLVAEGVSALVCVRLRRNHHLYLNDGTYGSLAELKHLGNYFPVRVLRKTGHVAASAQQHGFDLHGPTCDSVDSMYGPFWISEDVGMGDWLEIGRLGAYSSALSTRFNGHTPARSVSVDDLDIMPICHGGEINHAPANPSVVQEHAKPFKHSTLEVEV